MKTCTCCKQTKPFELFYKSSTHKCGYTSYCRACESERCKARNKLNKERRVAKAKEWQTANKEAYEASIKAWRERNPDKYKQYFVDYREKNRGAVNAKWMKRDAAKKSRTPCWLTEEDKKRIQVEYELAAWCSKVMGEQYDVDHVIPLQGKTVSGLHVPSNLQVIPAAKNKAKSNRFNALEAA